MQHKNHQTKINGVNSMYYLEAKNCAPADKEADGSENVHKSKMVKDYLVIENVNRCLFTGDTLSIGGCDLRFLGSENRMLMAIDDICKLPSDTKIMPG